MQGFLRVMAGLLVVGLAPPLLAEDIEREPIHIDPPRPPAPPLRKKIAPPPPARPDEPIERLFDHPTTRRLHLELQSALQRPVEPPPPCEPTEAERVKGRIDGYFADLLAHERARRGNVDPGWHYLAERMEAYWTPDFSQVHDPSITEVSGPWLRRLVFEWLDDWYQHANRTASDGYHPADRDPYERVDTATLDMQRYAYASDGYGGRVTTLVEVRIGSTGELDADVHTSSGHPAFDRAAVEAVRRSLEHPEPADLPPGPARSLYALEARYAILPPLPVVGFSFDIMLEHFDLFYPLKKMVRGNARLVAVYR